MLEEGDNNVTVVSIFSTDTDRVEPLCLLSMKEVSCQWKYESRIYLKAWNFCASELNKRAPFKNINELLQSLAKVKPSRLVCNKLRNG